MEEETDLFLNREEAGFLLAKKLKNLGFSKNALVLAIPRGGIIVGKAVANSLGAELDIIIAKKLGAPGNPELAIGAVGQEGEAMLNKDLIASLKVSDSYIAQEIKKQKREAKRREEFFHHGRRQKKIAGRVVILVDDGVATGSTVLAAASIIKNRNPKKLVLAVPVASIQTVKSLEKIFDRLVVLKTPADFGAVGSFYRNFPQVEDWQVKQILEETKAKNEIKVPKED